MANTLPAMTTPFANPKFIFFTDFDGTITMQDSNDFMTDHLGFGEQKRREANKSVLDGTAHFRDSFRRMMDSITTPFPECIDFLVKNIQLDPYFDDFFRYALSIEMPIVIVSGGMEPIIRALLENLVGADADKLHIVSSDVEAREGKTIDQRAGWRIKYHDESGFGHDKSLTIRPYAQLPEDQRPGLFYAGDGVSDLSAARETDLLFAKKGHHLVEYCVREQVPFTIFEDWSSILDTVKKIIAGEQTMRDAARQGFEEYAQSTA